MTVRRICGLALVAGALACAGMVWWVGGRLVAPAHHAVALPPDLPVEALRIESPNGSLAAWWVAGPAGAPAVVLLHPVRGDRTSMVSRARLLAARRFSVLLVDLQAHGESPGEAITMGWREASDARAAIAWARARADGARVGAIGCSLGGAALLLGPQPVGLEAVVLEAVYPRLRQAVVNRIRLRAGPLAPLLAPMLLAQIEPRLGIDPDAVEPIRGISRLGAAVLVVAGSKDRHTTPAESRELFRAAAIEPGPKRLWVVRGAAHEDFLAADPAGYEREVVTFLSEVLHAAG